LQTIWDSFVAEGYVRNFEFERDGETIQREEFVAKKIGHDLARTNYDVDRTRRSAAATETDLSAVQQVVAPEAGPVRAALAAVGL